MEAPIDQLGSHCRGTLSYGVYGIADVLNCLRSELRWCDGQMGRWVQLPPAEVCHLLASALGEAVNCNGIFSSQYGMLGRD